VLSINLVMLNALTKRTGTPGFFYARAWALSLGCDSQIAKTVVAISLVKKKNYYHPLLRAFFQIQHYGIDTKLRNIRIIRKYVDNRIAYIYNKRMID
jgi:hypothetical protein